MGTGADSCNDAAGLAMVRYHLRALPTARWSTGSKQALREGCERPGRLSPMGARTVRLGRIEQAAQMVQLHGARQSLAPPLATC